MCECVFLPAIQLWKGMQLILGCSVCIQTADRPRPWNYHIKWSLELWEIEGKPATALLPTHTLRHTLSSEGPSSVYLRKWLPLFRTSGNVYGQPWTEKRVPLCQSGGEQLIKTSSSSNRQESAPNTREATAYQCFQPPSWDAAASSSSPSGVFHHFHPALQQRNGRRSRLREPGSTRLCDPFQTEKKPYPVMLWSKDGSHWQQRENISERKQWHKLNVLELDRRWAAESDHHSVILAPCAHQSPSVRGIGPSTRASPSWWNCSTASRNIKRDLREHYCSSRVATPWAKFREDKD